MLHEPATPSGRDPAGPYKARLGIWMFAFYTLFYAGFVLINLISPSTMATIVVAGLNLATVSGMALIVLALVQALIYNVMCRRREAEFDRLDGLDRLDSGSGDGSAGGDGADAGSGPAGSLS